METTEPLNNMCGYWFSESGPASLKGVEEDQGAARAAVRSVGCGEGGPVTQLGEPQRVETAHTKSEFSSGSQQSTDGVMSVAVAVEVSVCHVVGVSAGHAVAVDDQDAGGGGVGGQVAVGGFADRSVA